jgi:(2Fe-2S) ferredoxin
MADALLLVGMSVREVGGRDELAAVAAAAGGSIAFLQQGDPSLSRELTRLADEGVSRVVLVGVSLGRLAPAHSWLRRIAAYWWRERAGQRPVLDIAPRLLDSLEPDALVGVLTDLRPITGEEPGLTSAAWEDVTAHRHQVMLCRGPRCTAKGSDASVEAVIIAMMEHDLGDDDVLLVHTGCQFPCNRAPVISVQPDDIWYGGVDPDAARRIVGEHLVGGRPVETHRLPRA